VTRYRVLGWAGIPAQVKASAEGEKAVSRELSEWFTQHIDREAMKRGLYGSDEYLDQWEWSEYKEREGSPAEVADAVAAELEAEWEPVRKRWEAGEDD
jgi:hypothetical protein